MLRAESTSENSSSGGGGECCGFVVCGSFDVFDGSKELEWFVSVCLFS